jgi:hypothetical protein
MRKVQQISWWNQIFLRSRLVSFHVRHTCTIFFKNIRRPVIEVLRILQWKEVMTIPQEIPSCWSGWRLGSWTLPVQFYKSPRGYSDLITGRHTDTPTTSPFSDDVSLSEVVFSKRHSWVCYNMPYRNSYALHCPVYQRATTVDPLNYERRWTQPSLTSSSTMCGASPFWLLRLPLQCNN